MKNSSSSSPNSCIISRKPLRIRLRKIREEVRARARTLRAAANQLSQSMRSEEEEVLAPVPEEPQMLQFPSNPNLELNNNKVDVNAEEVVDLIPDEPKTPQFPTKPNLEVENKAAVNMEAKIESQEREQGERKVVKAKIVEINLNLPPADEEFDDEEARNN